MKKVGIKYSKKMKRSDGEGKRCSGYPGMMRGIF